MTDRGVGVGESSHSTPTHPSPSPHGQETSIWKFVPVGPEGGVTCTDVPGEVDVVNTSGEVVAVLVLAGGAVLVGVAGLAEEETAVVVEPTVVGVTSAAASVDATVGNPPI
jgi:hypothetical protein